MISLIFTYSDKIGSRLIRDISKSKTSHMAWLLDEKLVFQSNFSGVHPLWRGRFEKENVIHYKIDLDMLTLPEEESLYLALLSKYDGRSYDYGALFYQGFAWLAYRLKIARLSTANKWSSKSKFLCVELAKPLAPFGIILPDLESITPDNLYKYLSQVLKGKMSTKG